MTNVRRYEVQKGFLSKLQSDGEKRASSNPKKQIAEANIAEVQGGEFEGGLKSVDMIIVDFFFLLSESLGIKDRRSDETYWETNKDSVQYVAG